MNSGKSESKNNCNIFDITSKQRVPKYFKPLEVIIQLEGSGKWPNDINALQRVKASFYIELSQRLSKQYGLLAYINSDYLDVLQDGFIFRIIIACHKELVLLRQIKTSEGLIKTIDSEIADNLELKTEILPKISSALNAINRKYVCFGISCRLTKRWIASQMIGFYFDDIAIELIMAYIYLNSSPFTVPKSVLSLSLN
jgi:U3 small nucleolar RNA-associated protein 22